MTTLRVRYRTGDTDEWELHDQVELNGFLTALLQSSASGSRAINFGVVPQSGEAYEYGTAFVRLDEVVMWTVDGILDVGQIGALWPMGDVTPEQ